MNVLQEPLSADGMHYQRSWARRDRESAAKIAKESYEMARDCLVSVRFWIEQGRHNFAADYFILALEYRATARKWRGRK